MHFDTFHYPVAVRYLLNQSVPQYIFNIMKKSAEKYEKTFFLLIPLSESDIICRLEKIKGENYDFRKTHK